MQKKFGSKLGLNPLILEGNKEETMLGSWIDHARPVKLVVRLYKKKGGSMEPSRSPTTSPQQSVRDFPAIMPALALLLAGLAGSPAAQLGGTVPCVYSLHGLDRFPFFRAANALAFALRPLDLKL